MEGAFGFVEDEGVGAAADYGDGFGGVGRWLVCDAGYFYSAGAGGLDFVEEFGGAEFVFGEGVDVRDGFAADALWVLLGLGVERERGCRYLAYEFDFVAFDVFDR